MLTIRLANVFTIVLLALSQTQQLTNVLTPVLQVTLPSIEQENVRVHVKAIVLQIPYSEYVCHNVQ